MLILDKITEIFCNSVLPFKQKLLWSCLAGHATLTCGYENLAFQAILKRFPKKETLFQIFFRYL